MLGLYLFFYWVFTEFLLGFYWVCTWSVLVLSGFVLGLYWACIGLYWFFYWVCNEFRLDSCWALAAFVLCSCLTRVWFVLVCTDFVLDLYYVF